MALFSKKQPVDLPRRRQNGTPAGNARREVSAERQQASNTTFKRNRTLTGSASSHVSSVNEQQADMKSPRTHMHDLAAKRRKVGGVFIGVIAAVAVCGALLYQFTVTPKVTAQDYAITLQADRYETVINKYLEKYPIERLRFSLNEYRLSEYMKRELSEVVEVRQDGFAGFGASTFVITLRQPIAGWLIGDKQYYVDASGVPFERNYYSAPTVRVVDDSGIQQTAGTAIASSRFLTFVGRTVSLSQQYGLTVEQATIPVATTRQVEVRVAGHDFPIKLSLDRPVGEQIEDMQRAIVYFDNLQKKPKYIDVRVSGKAFYRE